MKLDLLHCMSMYFLLRILLCQCFCNFKRPIVIVRSLNDSQVDGTFNFSQRQIVSKVRTFGWLLGCVTHISWVIMFSVWGACAKHGSSRSPQEPTLTTFVGRKWSHSSNPLSHSHKKRWGREYLWRHLVRIRVFYAKYEIKAQIYSIFF